MDGGDETASTAELGSPRSGEPSGAPAELAIPFPEGIGELQEGVYHARFARTTADLDRVLRLRFEVFNRELQEGLATSWMTGRDEDEFDQACHHLMLVDRSSGDVVGTYRMQTSEMARAGAGLYCDREFDLSTLPESAVESSIEIGRACILPEHRNGTALFVLWRGLAAYLTWSKKHLLFGCCSLTSQDPAEGESMLRRLRSEGRISPDILVDPRPEFACKPVDGDVPSVDMPRLFGTYIRYGALACGPPAIDREFGTIDFFIVLDSNRVHPRLRAMFFSNLPVAENDGTESGESV